MAGPNDVPHPGIRIKAEVIPQGMTVIKAAELIGVGRPALSKLLNGKAALSIEMATRLAKAFDFPRDALLEMQSKFDAAQADKITAPAEIKAYVPPFLGIKANQIEQWVPHNTPARSRLSVFLRTLVHSTGRSLTKVDFPGNDDAERPGWDGFIETEEGTPWIPAGTSGWEFGTNENINQKATKDFNKSVKALGPKERDEITFVFVTPRRWQGKSKWIDTAKKKGLWKDVRAYDAVDLEQWIEQSIPGQAWFANETHIPSSDVRSLDKCWTDWANVSNPSLTGELFNPAIKAFQHTILSCLSKPSDGPVYIAADSTEEALAFLAQIIGERGGDELAIYRDRILVFDKPGILPRLAQGAPTFIPVVVTREVERELAPYANSTPSIVVYPRNVANITPHITLEPISNETFSNALEAMGKKRDEISRLENESGRSLTVLRRRVATVEAVRTPNWAKDQKIAASLVPFFFAGAWNSANEIDKIGLELLAGGLSYAELERQIQSLTQQDDSPVWSIGTYRGVISKTDLLYSIAAIITHDDLKQYFSMARMVLGEDDPALDLEEEQRWAANIYGKTREFSTTFRKSISETLVLLSVHSHLFEDRIGVNTEQEARQVVRELLPTPLTPRILEANDHDLPTYAEAAPDEFLSILERDLKTTTPAVLGLMRPADTSLFGASPSYTGLLWALEGLAWNPSTLPRSVFILAQLALAEPNDNWSNKPTNSLQSIFRAWMPQTAANHEARVDLIKKLVKRFPKIAWKICVAQFNAHTDFGTYSHKPTWRPDGYGFGESHTTWEPIHNFQFEMVAIALNWEEHTLETLCDLVERLHMLDINYQNRVWELIEKWTKTATDADKSTLREKIRLSILSRRAVLRTNKDQHWAALTSKAKQIYTSLEPDDILEKYSWLFRNAWVDASADELASAEEINFEKRDELIQRLRVEAMREVIAQQGFHGILELAKRGGASGQIGWLLAEKLLPEDELVDILLLAYQQLQKENDSYTSLRVLIAGALGTISDFNTRDRVLRAIITNLPEEDTAHILVFAPFCKSTWSLVDELRDIAQTIYWTDVRPDWIQFSEEESNEGIRRLLKAGRPRAAFYSIRHSSHKLEAKTLYSLLSAIINGGKESPDEYLLKPYHIDKALICLNKSHEITLEQKAHLEFAFLDALVHSWGEKSGEHGIPNLEKYIELHSELFVQLVASTYKRRDNRNDPAELRIPPDKTKEVSKRCHKLLEAITRIPGHDEFGELKAERLAIWIASVRKACADLSRADVGDICLGQLLAHAPVGHDNIWPCESVRQVLEEIQSEQMMRGMHTGAFNSRGARFSGEGGDQEWTLAEKYRKWGQALQTSYPFVASMLLSKLADTYEHHAKREDTEAKIRRRLH
ncbi:HigA family addiction module antidote protein [Desulfovibrio aerotolerans]|uniref:HigA family addiction module antidote protein n=1 Tax=Solidesulfovibrio aerotolerans TaxID=295255 RepID=A0A7C9N0P9_9BACT|nr:HigA family addiction module antitoxin [Solidesulfovibrio aerotolerans]MYL83437.1 HigA family addiction module antidote protein [Solidesulfovibrio aerotolerans]